MVATADVRFKRMKQEYLTLHGAQDELMGKVDTYKGALLGLTEMIAGNRDLIAENRDLLLENREMLRAIIEHLQVPYKKPPMGFRSD